MRRDAQMPEARRPAEQKAFLVCSFQYTVVYNGRGSASGSAPDLFPLACAQECDGRYPT